MSEENWVKLPGVHISERPGSLPSGTQVRFCAWVREPREISLDRDYELGRSGVYVGPLPFAPHNVSTVLLPPGYHFSGSEVVKEEPKPELLAGTVGLEKYADEAYVQSVLDRWIQAKPSDGLGANGYVFRQGDYEQQRFSAIQSQAQAQQRALEKLTKRPACSCGATENVRVVPFKTTEVIAGVVTERTEHRMSCGACYQQQRRTELQAAKLDQTKRDTDRPVKRDPYEWLGFSSPTWEE